MLQTLLTTLKEIVDLDPNKKTMIMSWLFSGFVIWYLYNNNESLIQKISEHEKNCQLMIAKSQESCDEQLKINREKSQTQINNFIEQSNSERDSIYRYFYKEIRSYNIKVNKGIQELNNLKDENDN